MLLTRTAGVTGLDAGAADGAGAVAQADRGARPGEGAPRPGGDVRVGWGRAGSTWRWCVPSRACTGRWPRRRRSRGRSHPGRGRREGPGRRSTAAREGRSADRLGSGRSPRPGPRRDLATNPVVIDIDATLVDGAQREGGTRRRRSSRGSGSTRCARSSTTARRDRGAVGDAAAAGQRRVEHRGRPHHRHPAALAQLPGIDAPGQVGSWSAPTAPAARTSSWTGSPAAGWPTRSGSPCRSNTPDLLRAHPRARVGPGLRRRRRRSATAPGSPS